MIGIFDSGLGGLSVRKELAKIMPNQDFCYIADSAYCPYGRKSPQELQKRTINLTQFLINQGNCDIIVVACNTATAAAIEVLRSTFSIPFVGMEPAIKPALLKSKTGVVGVLATAGTFKGTLYHRTLTQFQGDVKVIEKIGDGLVELVENNITDSEESYQLIKKYINPIIESNADHIVLGCTHYPFLIKMINRVLDENLVKEKISIINPAPAVALQTKKIIEKLNKSNSGGKTLWNFYSTGNKNILSKFVQNIITDDKINIEGKNLHFNHLNI